MFLGRDLGQHRDYSKVTAQKIDDEVRGIVVGGHEKATQLIEDNLETLRKISSALLENETLNGRDLDALMAAGKNA